MSGEKILTPQDTASKKLYYPNTYIREVAIELSSSYSFDNSPHERFDNLNESHLDNKPFVGREDERKKFKKMLEGRKGVYLVTGYRGMGKTSFVNRVVTEYINDTIATKDSSKRADLGSKKNKTINKSGKRKDVDNDRCPIKRIKITLAQKPTEGEILRLMVSSIYGQCKTHYRIDKISRTQNLLLLLTKVFGFSFLAMFLFIVFNKDTDQSIITTNTGFEVESLYLVTDLIKISMWSFFGIALCVSIIYIIHCQLLKFPLYISIESLFKRCYAVTTLENENKSELLFESFNAKIGSSGPKRTENYPIASSKEIEYELTSFVEAAKIEHLEFIFIFDELDKVEQNYVDKYAENDLTGGSNGTNPEKAYLEQLRERKQAVLNIIAGLKNFLTSTKAPFIFIAGREMFDASLADIADRQSSISSIFNYVFYIESLLREYDPSSSSLSVCIEQYLMQLIYGPGNNEASLYQRSGSGRMKQIEEQITEQEKKCKRWNIRLWTIFGLNSFTKAEKTLAKLLKDKCLYESDQKRYDKHFYKVNLLLQSFVVFLAYRSNGSPKKLIRLIQDFVEPEISGKDLDKMIHWNNLGNEIGKNRNYLHFNLKNQQRVGFINYIYRPFLIRYGSSFKKYSDNLIVSTSYLFDHFLKFHPFAFSMAHLELIPEVMSANRTPALRDHIKKIIDYLLNNHLKETEIGLFDFKFYSKTINEILYLSKTFEDESAAFNFTLDESYLTKLHVKAKLRELRETHAKYVEAAESRSRLIFSIAYLNGILGDLHFFDQEYDDAIIAYSDVLNPIRGFDITSMTMRDFILLMRFKLKLGLTFEKLKSFDESLSFYADAAEDANRFVIERTSVKYLQEDLYSKSETKDRDSYYISSSLSDVLQIVNQAFIAIMVLQEKMGIEGFTGKKSTITIGAFLHLAKKIEIYCGPSHAIIANFFLQIGNLLYFKNSLKGFQWDEKEKGDDNPIPEQYRIDMIDFTERYHSRLNGTDQEIHTLQKYRKPVVALNMYCIGLKYLLEGKIVRPEPFTFGFSEQERPVTSILKKLQPSELKKYSTYLTKIHYKYIAIFLSHIGDCILGMIESDDSSKDQHGIDVTKIFQEDKLTFMLADHSKILPPDIFERLFDLGLNDNQGKELTIHYVICCFYLSGYYFKLSDRSRSHSFQLRKILYTIRIVLHDEKLKKSQSSKRYIKNQFIAFINLFFVRRILEISSENTDYGDVHDVNKFTRLLSRARTLEGQSFILNNVSNSPDTREAILLFEHIKLKLRTSRILNDCSLVRSDYSISTQYTRLMELTYAAKYYEKILEQKEVFWKTMNADRPLKEFGGVSLKEIIINFLHALISIINIMDIYDNDYLVGSSFLAYHHFRIARFFDFTGDINHYGILHSQATIAKNSVLEISSNKTSYSLCDPHYHYRMAALNYDKAINLHTAGSEYKRAISDIIYLEDDLNDASYHFGAAMDRYLLVNGTLHKYFDSCNQFDVKDWNSPEKFIPLTK